MMFVGNGAVIFFCTAIALLPQLVAGTKDTFIYSNDDLILVNPIQSTAVLLSIIAASTAIEFLFERFSKLRNRYVRVIYLTTKKELTVLSLGVMSCQFVVNSFPTVSDQWRVVVEWVALCVVYLTITYALMVIITVLLLKWRSKSWRTFEWARIEADSHHSLSEQVFKLAKRYFVLQLEHRLQEGGNMATNIPPVAFSSFVTLIECDVLRELLTFSLKTWLVLAVFIFANATRSMTVASLDSESVSPHIISFIILIGCSVSAVQIALYFMLRQRMRNFTTRQLSPATKVEGMDSLQGCLFFGSVVHTLELVKAVLLVTMWFVCVFLMGFAYSSIDEYKGVAAVVYIAALVPVAIVVFLTPRILNLVTFSVAMATENRDAAIVHLSTGGVVAEDVSSDDDSDEEGLDAQIKLSKREQRAVVAEEEANIEMARRGRGYLNLPEYEGDGDEYNGPTVSLNGADGGLLEDEEDRVEAAAHKSRVNHFGHKREDEDGEDEGRIQNRFIDSKIYFSD